MAKTINLFVIIVTLILLLSLFFGCIKDKENKQKTGPQSLQEIIDNAKNGETIKLGSKIYMGNFKIDKNINLIGIKGSTTIDGGNNGSVILINSDNVNIKNLIIRNSGGNLNNAGIKIKSNNNIVENCTIYRTKTGLYFDNCQNNKVKNSYLHTNGEGIYYENSKRSLIELSEFQHNAFGIHLYNSDSITIKNSYIHTNGLGVYARENNKLKIKNCAISDHNQDGGGCWIFDSKGTEIDNCNINHNGAGIKLQNSEAKVTNTNLEKNMFISVQLINSKNVVFSNCEIIDTYRTGFQILNTNCEIKNNNIENSMLKGIAIDKKSNCDIRNNWWGRKLGPSITEISKGEQITIRLGKVKFIPWSKQKYQQIGSNWKIEDVFVKTNYVAKRFRQINFDQKDTDSDGLPDWWEEKWGYNKNIQEDHQSLDIDNDGLNNFEECFTDKYGSSPFYKDIFIELDWLESMDKNNPNKLSKKYIQDAVEIFRNHEINLHIDTGELDGGEEIPISQTSSFSDLQNLYWDYFLHNDLDNPRKGIFHYMLIMNKNPETYAGFVFIGWDHLDSMSLCIQQMHENHKNMDKSKLIIYGIVHELGHQMGVLIDDFGGIDNTKSTKPFSLQFYKYYNYKSVMNYQKYLKILTYSDGKNAINDFDDWSNLDFTFFKNTNFNLNLD